MKTIARFAVASLLCASAFAQGRITFSNTDLPNPSGGGTYNAVITFGGNLPPELRDYRFFTAGLFQEGSTTALVSTPFFNGTGEDAQFNWMFLNNPEAVVPNVPPGQTARLWVGIWHNSSATYDGAPWRAPSEVFTSRPLGGPNPTPGEPAFFTPVTTFTGFQAFVPEPTITSFAVIGLGALALRRRK